MASPAGTPNGNDTERLADDPMHKLLVGRDPVTGASLALQPTISRFENGVGRAALYRLGRRSAVRVIERHQRRLRGKARRITIDLDPTDDATYGAQQSGLLQWTGIHRTCEAQPGRPGPQATLIERVIDPQARESEADGRVTALRVRRRGRSPSPENCSIRSPVAETIVVCLDRS